MSAESFDAGKISWLKPVIADELHDWLDLGWHSPVFHAGPCGGHDVYIIRWDGEGDPPRPGRGG